MLSAALSLLALPACQSAEPLGQFVTPETVAPLEVPDPGDRGTRERALLDAARYGNSNEVRKLLAAGTDIDAKGDSNITPLMNAIATGHDDIVELLIAHGADIDFQDKTGHTPLMRAVLFGTGRALRLLLEAGAKVDTMTFSGDTALGLAISNARYEAAHLLLDSQADIHLLNHRGNTPLLLATDLYARRGVASLTGRRHHEVAAEEIRLVERLLALGADPNARNENGWTPLMVAAESAPGRIVQILVEHGADRTAVDEYGLRAFHWGYRANREDAVLALLALQEDLPPGVQYLHDEEISPDRRASTSGGGSEVTPDGPDAMPTEWSHRRMELRRTAAEVGIPDLEIPPDERLPQINDAPTRVIAIQGRVPRELEVKLRALYAPATEGADCDTSDSLMVPMEFHRDGDHYQSSLVFDRFAPGHCAWRFLIAAAYVHPKGVPDEIDATFIALNGDELSHCDPVRGAACELSRDDSMPAQARCRRVEGRLRCLTVDLGPSSFKAVQTIMPDTERFLFDIYFRDQPAPQIADTEESGP